MKCEHCGKEHDGSFGSGRFCCRSCANSRHYSKKIKDKISKGVIKYNKENKLLYTYVCEKCGKTFESTRTFKQNRHIHCSDCIQQYKHSNENPNTIFDLSKRTISKILKRANVRCSICGWNEASCDIHHIQKKKYGGTDELSNLIIVCPNCHRIIHTTNKYNKDFLFNLSIDKTFSDWKDFYYISN